MSDNRPVGDGRANRRYLLSFATADGIMNQVSFEAFSLKNKVSLNLLSPVDLSEHLNETA